MAYNSDKKPLELTAITTLATDDTIIVGDTSDTSEVAKSITYSAFTTLLDAKYAAVLGADDNYVTDAEKVVVGNTSGINTGDQTVPVKATSAELDTGTDDAKFATALAIAGSALQTKVDGVEALADVTDTTNVTAAGALMDSEVTNLAQVKAFDTTDYATAAQGTTADSAVQPASTNTLTNKRITKRSGAATSSATPTINTDNVDAYYLTAQAAAITSFTTNLTGTPVKGDTLFISVIGTAARAITFGASFANGPVALPTTTVTTTELSVLFKHDGTVWRCYATGSTV